MLKQLLLENQASLGIKTHWVTDCMECDDPHECEAAYRLIEFAIISPDANEWITLAALSEEGLNQTIEAQCDGDDHVILEIEGTPWDHVIRWKETD